MRMALQAAVMLLGCSAAAQTLPNIKPGDSCGKLRGIYGKEISLDGPAHVWKQGVIETTVLVKPNGPCVAGEVRFSVDTGHTVATHDGIILNSDTTASAAAKVKGRIDSTSYYFINGEGKAYAMLEVPPSPGFPFKQTFGWLLSQARTSKLNGRPPQLTDFSTEPVTFYSLDLPNE